MNPIPSLFTIAPANRDHEVGLRCAFSVFVPLILLLVLDRVDLAVFASFGGLMVAVLLAGTLVARAGWADTTRPWALVAWNTMVAGVCAGLAVMWYVIAAGVAGVLATLLGPVLGIGHSYWALVAAVVPLVDHSTRYSVNRGLQRIIGTFLGLGVLAVVLWLDPPLWAVVVLIALLQLLAEMYIARQYVLAQMVVTPVALFSTVLASAGAAAEAGGRSRRGPGCPDLRPRGGDGDRCRGRHGVRALPLGLAQVGPPIPGPRPRAAVGCGLPASAYPG